jgi:hypothetical protein
MEISGAAGAAAIGGSKISKFDHFGSQQRINCHSGARVTREASEL